MSTDNSHMVPSDILDFALNSYEYDAIVEMVESFVHSDDKWVVNSCVLSIDYLALDFKKYPKALKEILWKRANEFPDFPTLIRSMQTADNTIGTTGAIGM